MVLIMLTISMAMPTWITWKERHLSEIDLETLNNKAFIIQYLLSTSTYDYHCDNSTLNLQKLYIFCSRYHAP